MTNVIIQNQEPAIHPEVGDVTVSTTRSEVSVHLHDGKTWPMLAYTLTLRGLRALYIRHDGKFRPVEARDFTPRKANDNQWLGYLLARYLPELLGRRIVRQTWRGFEIVGNVLPCDPPARKSAKSAPAAERTILEGSILSCSWGYEQTNIDYYLVQRRSAAFAWLVPIGKKNVQNTEWLQGTCEPDPTKIVGTAIRRKISVWDCQERGVSICSYKWASPWKGGKDHWTAYA